MLTTDILKANDKLKALPDDVLKAIEELSKADEQKTIDDNRADWWGRLDQDVESVFGEAKPGGVKSHEHHKNWLIKIKADADKGANYDKLNGEIETLKKEKKNLEDQIKKGSQDSALKEKVGNLEKEIGLKNDEIRALKEAKETETGELSKKLKASELKTLSFQIDSQLSDFLRDQKIKFLAAIPEDIVKDTIKAKKEALLNELDHEFIDGKLVFSKDGKVLRNPTTIKPSTFGELLLPSIESLIDKKSGGGGTKPNGTGGGDTTIIDVSSAKTQVEADEMIVNHMMKVEGRAKTDSDWSERQMTLRTEHNVDKLPIRE